MRPDRMSCYDSRNNGGDGGGGGGGGIAGLASDGISRLSKSRSTVEEEDADAELVIQSSQATVWAFALAMRSDGVAGLALDNISRLSSSWSTVDGHDADIELVPPFLDRSIVWPVLLAMRNCGNGLARLWAWVWAWLRQVRIVLAAGRRWRWPKPWCIIDQSLSEDDRRGPLSSLVVRMSPLHVVPVVW
jgi:hypothetical protein